MRITFGAMCRPLAEQASIQGMSIDDAELIQSFADAVCRLHIHGVLTDKDADRCRKRIVKKMKIREVKQ